MSNQKIYWCIIWIIVFLFSAGVQKGFAGTDEEKFRKMWNDSVLNDEINKNIDNYRKSDAVIKIISEDGKPLAGAEIKVEQISHEFLFGCNMFYFKCFKTEEQNDKYESAFLKLFNFATIPFYWSDLEPEQGNVRFGKDSEFILRRPPPDLCVEWGLKHNLTLKGHPLIWQLFYPEWLPKDQSKVTQILSERFKQIAQRYAKSITIWDVVNEALRRPVDCILPEDYVCWSYKEADRWFRPDNILMANEDTPTSYNYLGEDSHYYLLLMKLKLSGIRFDGIGFQFHVWNNPRNNEYKELISGSRFNPRRLTEIYNQYGKYDKPLYITEITVPTIRKGTEGQAMQAFIVRNLYRLWFSIPKMAGITWWNLGDGTAYSIENSFGGGLLDEKLEPKESYKALDELINHEWKTQAAGKTFDNGVFVFRGFYGKYNVKVNYGKIKKEFEINVSKDGGIYHTFILKEQEEFYKTKIIDGKETL